MLKWVVLWPESLSQIVSLSIDLGRIFRPPCRIFSCVFAVFVGTVGFVLEFCSKCIYYTLDLVKLCVSYGRRKIWRSPEKFSDFRRTSIKAGHRAFYRLIPTLLKMMKLEYCSFKIHTLVPDFFENLFSNKLNPKIIFINDF